VTDAQLQIRGRRVCRTRRVDSCELRRLRRSTEAARNIDLALHELATNASKYGALSVPEGKVSVHWGLTNTGGRRYFRMSSRESGGPMVTEPKCWGFGR
jgi:two-component sensor histidine kinase